MQEFDPRRAAVRRFAPKVTVAVAAIVALGFGAKLTSAAPTPKAPPLAVQNMGPAQPAFIQQIVPVEVQRGETMQEAVERTGIAPDEARNVVNLMGEAFDIAHIRAGLAFQAAVQTPRDRRGDVRLVSLTLPASAAKTITISRTFDGALQLHQQEEEVRDQQMVASGEIQGSLYEAAVKAGATPQLTHQVVQLFAHKLDFTRDIQPGDKFSLVFDRKVTESGKIVETGDLLYAELDANGKTTRFYRFERKDGGTDYFDETGKNIKGFLLRTPVDGARITSRFGMRKHPVLGYTRAHQGIDFGAGTGTPILAAGDGVVAEAGRKGGYGNWLRIHHSGGWDTGYGHISRYAKGIHRGSRVKQGQVVAYVGATGLATGPHLHYEVWKNGARVNPLSAKVPQGTILAGRELAAFKAQKARIDATLERGQQTQFAAAGAKDRQS
jgi:murein DD-endopeptidase MepM/ murein hydrolase activator NlpD